MDTDAYYTYIHETLDRGNLEEIFDLYRLNSLSKDGLIVLTLIDKVTPTLAMKHRYPKFARFRDLIVHHWDVTSPLHKMHVNNGFILVPGDSRIPFEKKEFFRLLRRTPSIKGVRIIFGVKDPYGAIILESWEDVPSLAFCCVRVSEQFDLTTYGSHYYKDWDRGAPSRPSLLKISEGKKKRLSYTEILEDERIDEWFNPNSPITDRMYSGDIQIFTNFGGSSNSEFLLKMCDLRHQGLVFNGVDEDGEYIFGLHGDTKVVPFYYVSCANNGLRISFYQYIDHGWLKRMQFSHEVRQTLPVIPKNIPRDARKSILLYHIQDMEFPKDFEEAFGLIIDEVRRYSEKGICYYVSGEDILYLTINEALQEGEVITLDNGGEYRIFERVFTENGINTYSILEL